jgi:hypothetical protein
MKRLFSLILFCLVVSTAFSQNLTPGPYGIALGEDISLSLEKIKAAQGVYKISTSDIQGENVTLTMFSLGNSPNDSFARLNIFAADNKLVYWNIGSQNSDVTFSIARQLFPDASFEVDRDSAWLMTSDAFVAIAPDYKKENMFLNCFSLAYSKSKKNPWITGQFNAFLSGYNTYIKYIKNGGASDLEPGSSTKAKAASLFEIVKNGSLEEITKALSSGANVNGRDRSDDYNKTPLMIAAEFAQNPDVIDLLLKAGAEVNAIDVNGKTPLMYAAYKNQIPGVLSALIKAGANVNARDSRYSGYGAFGDRGWTPLMYAATNNQNPEIVQLLLVSGADIKALEYHNKSAFDLAKDNKGLIGTEALKKLGQAY